MPGATWDSIGLTPVNASCRAAGVLGKKGPGFIYLGERKPGPKKTRLGEAEFEGFPLRE
jgi:hypothetical protein